MTDPLINPTPSLRYTLAKGTIPDFNISSSFSVLDPNVTFTFTTNDRSQSVTADTTALDPSDPASVGAVMYIVYADEKRIVIQIDGFLVAVFENGEFTVSVSTGSVSCANGVVTIYTMSGFEDIIFDAPSWCYYLDPDGDHGSYPLGVLSTGLYGSDDPMCPFCYDLALTGTILYNSYQFVPPTEGDARPYTENTPSIITTEGKVTAIGWTVDGTAFSAMTSIFPITVEPVPETSSMLEIPVTYDPATRHISLPRGYDMYGGATTDVNSVKLVFSGITEFGTDFVARVDFAVPVRIGDHTISHPFVLLEQDNGGWSAIVPNAVLLATKDTRKLPFQLVLANDSQVINSRNTIILETTAGIDSTIPGSELPAYEAPEWPLPTGASSSIDVHTVEVTYDPETRTMSVPLNGNYGGATIDTNSVRINVTGIVPTGNDFAVRIDYAAPIRINEGTVIKPFTVLEQINSTWTALVPQAVLMAAKETKKLPIQLVTRHDDVQINSRNTIVLEITRAINAMDSVESAYEPFIMFRNDTWAWNPNIPYSTGSVVTYDGDIYVAKQDSIGQTPGLDSEYWGIGAGTTLDLNGDIVLDPSIYAPVTSGTAGQYLVSGGANNAPVWIDDRFGATGDDITERDGVEGITVTYDD